MDSQLQPEIAEVTRELDRFRRELRADISADLADRISEQLDARVAPLAKRIADIKDMSVAFSRGVRDLKRPPQPQPPSVRSLLIKSAVCHLCGVAYRRPAAQIAARLYGNDQRVLETLANPGAFVARAIASPASTTSISWAAELVSASNHGAIAALAPMSTYSRLAQRGLRVSLEGSGSVRVPVPATASDVAGAFTGEGTPVPAKRMTLAGPLLAARKLAVVSTYSAEIFEMSAPNIEALIRRGIADDTGLAVDAVLLDDRPADEIRPAGLRSGVTPLVPSTGSGLEALAGDVRQLIDAVSASGPLVDPVLLVDTASEVVLRLLNPLPPLPVIASAVLAPKTAVLIDGGDFCSGESDDLSFDVSKEAVIHEATDPEPISTAGTVAAPTRSLWQTDTISLRMRQSLSWVLRRPGRVAWMEGTTW